MAKTKTVKATKKTSPVKKASKTVKRVDRTATILEPGDRKLIDKTLSRKRTK